MTRASTEAELLHDFNNLLTAIISASDAVLDRKDLDAESRADIESIREGARRGSGLMRGRDGGAGTETYPVQVNETIRALSRLLAHRLGGGIVLTLALREPDTTIHADAASLDRVLLNLIVNAKHAMPAGGAVTLHAGPRVLTEATEATPDTIPAGDYVVIGLADTGEGISPERLPLIFEPGFTTRHDEGGAGLGLSSVREIVRDHGGFIAVDSVEGQGTRIEIYFPRRREIETFSTEAHAVVLVDDDALVRRVAETALRRAGWLVLPASSAREALEILRGSRCDLMISDVAMPGMDGLTLTRTVLARWPDLPVILTSGYARPAAEAFPAGKVSFLTKPYGRGELLDAVARARR